jgi:hypothetical protein
MEINPKELVTSAGGTSDGIANRRSLNNGDEIPNLGTVRTAETSLMTLKSTPSLESIVDLHRTLPTGPNSTPYSSKFNARSRTSISFELASKSTPHVNAPPFP